MVELFVRVVPVTISTRIQASLLDTVESILEQNHIMKDIPVLEQRLIFQDQQLQLKQTLAECGVKNGSNLRLERRMQSTEHPHAWQVIIKIESLIYGLCTGKGVPEALETIKELMDDYKEKAPKRNIGSYVEILATSYVPEVLTDMLVSSDEGNRNCAQELMEDIFEWCRKTSSKSLTYHASVLLEFVKLLRKVNGRYALYLYCREVFASLLERGGNGILYGDSLSDKSCIPYRELNLLVNEMASSLLEHMESSLESPAVAKPLTKSVCEFQASVHPLCTGIKEELAHPRVLQEMFKKLLVKMDQCLFKMEKDDLAHMKNDIIDEEMIFCAWPKFIIMLRELYDISKLFEGYENMFWSTLRGRKHMVCFLIVGYATRSPKDHWWLLKDKTVTDFETRRHLTMMIFPDEDEDKVSYMTIDRSQLFEASFSYINVAQPEFLHAIFHIEFLNEDATGVGVVREWYHLVCKEIFTKKTLFLACSEEPRRFFPNPACEEDSMHLQYYRFSGRVIALALMGHMQVGITLHRLFIKQLAGNYSVTLEDIRDADTQLYCSYQKILDMDSDEIDALGMSLATEELGEMEHDDLCSDGKNMKYIKLLIHNRFVNSISKKVEYFSKGFADIQDKEFPDTLLFQHLDLQDLDWMLDGNGYTITVEDWRAHTTYNGYEETDEQISWFWEIVERMPIEQKKNLLYFWTALRNLPPGGFTGLEDFLSIYKTTESEDHLPSSNTCFYRLRFPAYSSEKVMEHSLTKITREHFAYGFGNI
ncbi:hypothetical protein L6164_036568 [Bauhinia variegata]|uniref:Uncharacterized protein n=1 Tax=Bauhinia variegata TaxID=167791 RepID=A0ACB9KI85_BAUVA|nr:hypothetical protein L6164_036568 [Bauhinia variegata]